MTQVRRMTARDLIDQYPIGRFQAMIVVLGFATMVLDGFDIGALGFIAPQLRIDWGLSHKVLGTVLSAALIGQAIGAMIGGPLADRYGRRPVVITSVLCFGLWTLAAVWSTGPNELLFYRFFAGLGLGAAIPTTNTLISEYIPGKSRSFLITVALSGFTFGGAGGGFLSAWMLPQFGWRSVVLVGGVLPIALAMLLILWLPESLSFLGNRRQSASALRDITQRIVPRSSWNTYELIPEVAQVRRLGGIRTVVSPEYRFGTFMLWCGYFCILFLMYLFNSWLPTLIKEVGGYSVSRGAITTAMFQIGGTVGSLAIGWAMDRRNKQYVLVAAFVTSAVGLGLIGQSVHHYIVLCTITLLVGFCLGGGSVGINALSTEYYPTEARATGSSWMSGIGRMGAITSAVIGGQMLALGWSLSSIFNLLAGPALIAAFAMFMMKRSLMSGVTRRDQRGYERDTKSIQR